MRNRKLKTINGVSIIGEGNLEIAGGEGHSHTNKALLDSYTQTEANLASAVSLKHSNSQDHTHNNITALNNVSGVNTGDQDLSGKADVNHTHTKSQITDFAHGHSQSEITNLVNDLAGKETANANIQAHIASPHAPSNAQKNSDITKAEIEAKLTGEISTHTHAGGGATIGYCINVQALTSSPVDAQTIYFGMLPKAPTTTAGISKVYIRKAGTIKIAEIYCYSGTAGTNQSWSIYIRKNNTTDTLIQTVSLAMNERVFTNSSLNIPVIAGDYIEIKAVNPTWATNPLTTIFGGYIYIE